jgi:hypothetical protein
MSADSSTPKQGKPAGSATATSSTHTDSSLDVTTPGVTVTPKGGRDISAILGAVWMFVIIGAFMAGIIKGIFGVGEPRLDIVVAAHENASASTWNLTGRILFQGTPVPAPTLWAIVSDDHGNRFSPTTISNGPLGEFEIRGIPSILSGTNKPKTLEATIQARAHFKKDARAAEGKDVEGKETLAIGEQGGVRWVRLPLGAIIPLLSIFLGSIGLSLLRSGANSVGTKCKYYGSVFCALVLTIVMVAYLSVGLLKINLNGTRGEVVALGFANIYHGTYVKDVEPEWLLSFTSPGSSPAISSAATPDLASGFGAPLWVVFIAVLGSGIFTILIVIRGINDPVDLGNDGSVAKRLEEIVRHQFYILFSPIGAVFVYQLMVEAGVATRPVTVALVALAAGIALNLLLDKALGLVHGVVQEAAIKREKRQAAIKAGAQKTATHLEEHLTTV